MSDEATPDLTALLADLIAHHDAYRVNEDGWTVCICGHVAEGDDDDGSHARHLAEQITAAGFGPVRAVEAERDAAVRARNYAMRQRDEERAAKEGNWRALGEWSARAESAEAERDAARAARDSWQAAAGKASAYAEAAEAALAELREGIEALCDPANEGPRPYAVALDNDVILAVDTAYLRALLAPTPDREEER